MRDLARDARLLSLNTATLGPERSLEDAVEGCLRHEISGISPWRDKIAQAGLPQAARMIKRAGLTVTGVCRGGMFPAADAAGRRKALEDNRRAIDEAAVLEAEGQKQAAVLTAEGAKQAAILKSEAALQSELNLAAERTRKRRDPLLRLIAKDADRLRGAHILALARQRWTSVAGLLEKSRCAA